MIYIESISLLCISRSKYYRSLCTPFALLQMMFLLILSPGLAGQPIPGKPGGADDESRCLALRYADALKAAKEASVKLAEAEKDPRAPAVGISMSDYIIDLESDIRLEKIYQKEVTKSKEISKKANDELNAIKLEIEKIEGLTPEERKKQVEAVKKKLQVNSQGIMNATQAQLEFERDPDIVKAKESMLAKQQAFFDAISQNMPEGTSVPVAVANLDDESYRAFDPAKAADNDALVSAATKLVAYKTFSPGQGKTYRHLIGKYLQQVEITADQNNSVFTDIRENATKLIAEIDSARDAVKKSSVAYTEARDQVTKLKKKLLNGSTDDEMDKTIANAENLTTLNDETRNLKQELAGLESFDQLTQARDKAIGVLESAKAGEDSNVKILAEKTTNRKKSEAKVASLREYDKVYGPIYKAHQNADAKFEKLKTALEKEKSDKATALTNANTVYDGMEKSLAEFKAKLPELRKTQKIGDLRTTVTKLKKDSIEKLKASQETLKPFRDCYPDVEEFVTKIKQKVVALGGVAEVGAGVSDMDATDPLLDIPLDKTKPVGPVWVRQKAKIEVIGENPNVTRTESGFSVKQDWQGKKLTGTLGWDLPAGELHEGDVVEIAITASGDANVTGWYNVNCDGEWIIKDNNAGSSADEKGGKNPHVGTLKFKFKPGNNPYIQVSAGQEPGTTRWILVTWKYELKK